MEEGSCPPSISMGEEPRRLVGPNPVRFEMFERPRAGDGLVPPPNTASRLPPLGKGDCACFQPRLNLLS